MQQRSQWLALMLLVTILLAGCNVTAAPYKKVEPYTLVKGDDGINTVTITEHAAERIQVSSTAVSQEEVDGKSLLVVPYGALIYDNNGGTWVYTNPAPLTYVRAQVVVDHIEGDNVYLAEGPEVGTDVAITAVAQLYGTDTGVGK